MEVKTAEEILCSPILLNNQLSPIKKEDDNHTLTIVEPPKKNLPKKILITGTGRCGTTFLIKLFTFLGFDTGFDKKNFSKFIFKNCNAGMEKDIKVNHHVIKSPYFIENIENIIKEYDIEQVIIPLRNYSDSAKSRVKNKKKTGGLWNANNEEEQLCFYHKIIANYVYHMTVHQIPTIFIHFERMIIDSQYLFDILQPILHHHHISFDDFLIAYQEASQSSKP